jgi:hypothetical protein
MCVAGVLAELDLEHAYNVDYVYVTVSMNFDQDRHLALASLAVEVSQHNCTMPPRPHIRNTPLY